jgi:DeoR/GlpR family transcriptional regulator of sugar metabolism
MVYHPDVWTLPDLAQLAAEGLVVRTHGGTILLNVVKNPAAFVPKSTPHTAEKATSG